MKPSWLSGLAEKADGGESGNSLKPKISKSPKTSPLQITMISLFWLVKEKNYCEVWIGVGMNGGIRKPKLIPRDVLE